MIDSLCSHKLTDYPTTFTSTWHKLRLPTKTKLTLWVWVSECCERDCVCEAEPEPEAEACPRAGDSGSKFQNKALAQ